MKYYHEIYQPSLQATVVLLVLFIVALIATHMHATARREREQVTQAVLLGGTADHNELGRLRRHDLGRPKKGVKYGQTK